MTSSPSTTYTRSKLLPQSSKALLILVTLSACVTSTTKGYDGSMMNGLNILPSYTEYFALSTATKALQTTSVWLGGIVASAVGGTLTNHFGRRRALILSALFTLFAVILQTASQNVAMFCFSRAFIGFGSTLSMVAGTTYVAETLPVNWRGWGVGLLGDLYYIGSFISAGVAYGAARIDSTWAWRLPSALQAVFSILVLLILPFVPESPRWLAMHGRTEEALDVVALLHSDGDSADPKTIAAYEEMIAGVEFEKNFEHANLKQIAKTPDLRMRVILVASCSVCAMLSGNNIVSFYLGDMLNGAGITNSTTQLEINIILSAFCLVVAVAGTWMLDKVGRKPVALISNSLMVVFLFLVGGLTKVYGMSENTSGIYGTVAMIFLFQGVYSFAWTPLVMVYPAEVTNYTMRAYGIGLMEFLSNCFGLLVVFAFPFAFAAISWKMYFINAAWDVLQVAFVFFYWVETAGMSLEQINNHFLSGRENVNIEGLNVGSDDDNVIKIAVVDVKKE